MPQKNWIIADKYPKNIIESILKSRGITDVREFLNPKDPMAFQLLDVDIDESEVQKVIDRLNIAKEKGETVVIYGDYDVDGICATALLWQTLHEFGVLVYPFIPDRFEDGYGMSISGIEKIRSKYPKASVIITVDNGIVAKEALFYAKGKGIDVIVTDHHEKHGMVNAIATVHTTKLCGTAIAWFLSRAILPVNEEYLRNSLDLVGFATVADQLKLVGVNRSLTYHGLNELRKSKRAGIIALCMESNVSQKEVGTYELGFVLGPRVNASGRISDALIAVRLFCTKSLSQAREIAQMLTELNSSRQRILSEVLDIARKEKKDNSNLIIIKGEFHEGVIGLAAGRLMEEFGKPAVVFSIGKEIVKASARSVSGVHITDLLRNSSTLPINVGGHEMAAGLSIHPKDLDEYIEVLTNEAKSINPEVLIKKRHIDCEVYLKDITIELFNDVLKLEPFGFGNQKPTFMTKDLVIKKVNLLGKSKEHIKLELSQGESSIEALLWNAALQLNNFSEGEKGTFVYSIDRNDWNGHIKMQILLKDYIIEHEKRTSNS